MLDSDNEFYKRYPFDIERELHGIGNKIPLTKIIPLTKYRRARFDGFKIPQVMLLINEAILMGRYAPVRTLWLMAQALADKWMEKELAYHGTKVIPPGSAREFPRNIRRRNDKKGSKVEKVL